jgi:hypothetical protein
MLSDVDHFGAERSAMVQWARLVLAKSAPERMVEESGQNQLFVARATSGG